MRIPVTLITILEAFFQYQFQRLSGCGFDGPGPISRRSGINTDRVLR